MSSYFKTSYSTLRTIAQERRFEDVAGFLVLARHASGLAIETFAPYTLSGAGVNSVHEKAGLSEETARGVVERLKTAGYIKPFAPRPDAKGKYRHARWEIVQGDLDLDLPHSLIDSLKGSAATPPLRRIHKEVTISKHYEAALKPLSLTELRLDALMLLLGLYRNTRMEEFGGVDPHYILRKWEVKSRIGRANSVRWGAEPDEGSNAMTYLTVIADVMPHALPAKKEPTELQKARFWNAWNNLAGYGLVYEAVTLFDTSIDNERARSILTIRVNDYHAGSIARDGDPSLLRELEEHFGSQFAYYTPVGNEREEPEAMWFLWPDDYGTLVGIWRLRYRASNRDTGAWIEKENAAIEKAIEKIVALAPQS